MRLVCRAVRQSWPISEAAQERVIKTLLRLFPTRIKAEVSRKQIGAVKALAALGELALKQEALDLRRQKLEGKQTAKPLADLVAEAEARAEARLRERKAK
jgi:hypothetical protein